METVHYTTKRINLETSILHLLCDITFFHTPPVLYYKPFQLYSPSIIEPKKECSTLLGSDNILKRSSYNIKCVLLAYRA
jgi:hypothetical protein